MSQLFHMEGTAIVSSALVSDTLVMLNGFSISGQATSIAFHDVAAVADVHASNLVFKVNGGPTFEQAPFVQTFEGVMFHKGLVVVGAVGDAAHTFLLNVEWE